MTDQLRALCMIGALAAAAVALAEVPPRGMNPRSDQWWWLLASLVLAALAQVALRLPHSAAAPPPLPPTRARWRTGIVLAVVGAVMWVWATRVFYVDWNGGFDRAWTGWLLGTALLAVGLDLASGRWMPASSPTPRSRWWLAAALVVTGLIAAWVRLGAIAEFPGPAGITQIEDLQFGNWGARFLEGDRRRWEFIGHTWISALSIAIGGAKLESMRIGYAIVGTLTVVAVFVWLHRAAGIVAAVVGAAYMTVSSWDAVVSRIGFNPDVLTIAVLFALLVGPSRRGRPSAFAIMGLLSGYLLWEYIAYRPAAVMAVAGGAWLSLRDRSAGWGMRTGRPALQIALIIMMSVPLFGTRLDGQVWNEYFNGLNRARAQKHYYNEAYDWQKVWQLRKERVLNTIGLLYFQGDGSPARNLGRRPLVDPVSATLMLVGFAGCAANPSVALFGLFAAGFVATVIGSMIVTADFNALRLSVAIPYLYFFVGVAGLGILTLWQRAWGRLGRWLAVVVLATGLVWSARENTTFLAEYWTAPAVRKAVRNNLAYLSNWMRENARADEQVVGVAGRSYNVLAGNDAAWLRGRSIPGVVEWDIMTALEGWQRDQPTMLLIFAGRDTRDTRRFLQTVVPGTRFTHVPDEEKLGADLEYARLPGRPANLDGALAELRCRGVEVEYVFRGEARGEVLKRVRRIEPLVGLSTWPSEVVAAFYRGHWPRRLEVRYEAEIEIERGGQYMFEADFYGAAPLIEIDERHLRKANRVRLDAGRHRLRVVADFAPLPEGLVARLLWSGPDSGDRKELIPFYAISLPSCGNEGSDNDAAPPESRKPIAESQQPKAES